MVGANLARGCWDQHEVGMGVVRVVIITVVVIVVDVG